MQSLRQAGGGVIIGILSLILVIGGISLALAETSAPSPTPTPIPPTAELIFPSPTIALQLTQNIPPTETASPLVPPTNTILPPTLCTPPGGWIQISFSAGDTIYSLAQRYKTSTESLSAANCLTTLDLPAGYLLYVPPIPTVTVIPCGPPAGWVRNHIVQAGDNLYRIALSYGITYPQLQRANCMGSSTTIYAGQRLWVPNIPTLTPVPGVTTIPDFPTATPTPTSTPTETSASPTEAPTVTASVNTAPTATDTPTPTSTPTSPAAP